LNQHNVFRTFLQELRPRARADYDHRDAARRAEVDALHAQVIAAAADPTLRAVLDLHHPVIETSCPWPVCRGCDSLDGPEAEPAEWPCRTWTLIQQRVAT
jgi:hypothetical protein